jgi:hypothetical protein
MAKKDTFFSPNIHCNAHALTTSLTLQLILNVDGCTAAAFMDLLRDSVARQTT